MSAETEGDKPDVFKNSVIVMLTLVSVFAALVTFLQNYAGLRSSDLAQRSGFNAVDATGLYFRAGLSAAQGTDTLQRYQDYLQRSVRADTKARALRMGGQGELAAEYDLDATRWDAAAAQVVPSDPLLADYGQDLNVYTETLSRDAYRQEEREHTQLEQSRAWSDKSNGYVAVLSTLSVSLFLAGLSLTLGSRLRYVLALASLGLTAVCAVWVLVIFFGAVPAVSDEAIEHFIEGRIKFNLARDSGRDAQDSIPEFDAALELAPDYGRALFYRSLANTDLSLLAKHLDTQTAIDDGLKAIALGNESSPVFGNLGWLYYLNGQYRSALEYTEQALIMSPEDCYLRFNHGLTLLALQRADEAVDAYTGAIDCAQRESSDVVFNNYMDAGVTDLAELAAARPDLGDSLDPAVARLKEALASLRMYGQLQENEVEAVIEPLFFGANVDSDNVVQDVAAEFPQSATIVYAQILYDDMRDGDRWMTRWVLDGHEYYSTVYDGWTYGQSGTAWVSLYNFGGLTSGTYTLDMFVEGQLVASGQVVVLPGDLPPMTSYSSSDVGVTISYPVTWRPTDLADNEVSVIAARDPDSADFVGVSAWVADTGTDADAFQFFDLYSAALEEIADDFSMEEREPFTVAGIDGWLADYEYTNAQGVFIRGALAGVVDRPESLVYMIVIESPDDRWEAQLELFNVMLERITIDD
jgi:tetratricopeptide (TPR) repeat protein